MEQIRKQHTSQQKRKCCGCNQERNGVLYEYGDYSKSVRKREGNIRAFASVVFEESFKVSNIAVIENKNGQCFVSMPRYASRKDDSGYKDICHPITKEFREQLYDGILKAYEQVQQEKDNRLQLKIYEADKDKKRELKFQVKATPFERDGSNLKGLARIYLEDCFVINNVSLLQGRTDSL